MIWPSLVGALAAALILDNWLLNDSPDPRSVAVKTYNTAVSKATPSVVNIYTAKLVLNNREPNLNSPLLKQLRFSHQGRRSVERSLGSGVILTEAGHIVTNNHVIRGADAIQVLLADGRSANALVVGEDPETDLAVLKIELPDLVPITVANSNDLLVGDVVLAIGNPFGFGHSVSQGIVSGVGRFGLQQTTYEAYIQTDATVHHGSSGGALINTKGGLVGINTLIYTAGGEADGITFGIGINLATPSELAEHVLKDVIKYGRVVRGWLGVSVEVLVVKGNNGTARNYKIGSKNIEMAGKTGTVQVVRISEAEREQGLIQNEDRPWEKRDHALFVGYAPASNPKYAISVVVEHGGSGSSVATPIARDIFKYIFKV